MFDLNSIEVGNVIHFEFGGKLAAGLLVDIENIADEENRYFFSFSDGDNAFYTKWQLKTIMKEYSCRISKSLAGLELI